MTEPALRIVSGGVSDKPPLPAHVRPQIEKSIERHKRRPVSPGINVESRPTLDGYSLEAPHSDFDAWEAQICEAFGTRSESTARVFISQLVSLCSFDDGDGKPRPNEAELNWLLNFISGSKPRNEMQATLLVEMAATHLMSMRIAASSLATGWIDPLRASSVAKLNRSFAQMADTYARQQGKGGKQKITVKYERHNHQHVHVHGGEGVSNFRTQVRAPRSRSGGGTGGQHERCASLQGAGSNGSDVSGSSGEGQGGV
jgi:hypothetical protein